MVELGIRVFTLILVLFTPPFTARICRDVSEIQPYTGPFTFGDMIAYDHFLRLPGRKCTLYIHWAVYVGHEAGLTARVGQQDIFHIYGPTWRPPFSACMYGNLAGPGEGRVFNYLDGIATQQTQTAVIQKINSMHNNCGAWDPVKNNCEHIATEVRYTQRFFYQPNTIIGRITEAYRNSG